MTSSKRVLLSILSIAVSVWFDLAETQTDIYRSPGEGDIRLGFVVPGHILTTVEGREQCGNVYPTRALLVAAFRRALAEVVQKEIVPRSLRITFEVMDTCGSVTIGFARLMQLNWLTSARDNETPLAVVIGTFTSRTSVEFSAKFAPHQIPLIDYGGTSPLLSNRLQHSFYARVTIADSNLAAAMGDLIKQRGWQCVHLFYSQGAYGESGHRAIQQSFSNRGICVVNGDAGMAPLGEDDIAEFDSIVANLALNSDVKILVCHCEDSTLRGLLLALQRFYSRSKHPFTIITGSFWGTDLDMTGIARETASGSITFQIYAPGGDGFPSWLSELDNATDPWRDESLRQICRSNKTEIVNRCVENRLPAIDRMGRVNMTVYAVAYGLRALLEENNCLGKYNCNIREIIRTKRPQLYEHIISSSFTLSDGSCFTFSPNGDGNPKYLINVYRQNTSVYGAESSNYYVLGSWTGNNGLNIVDETYLDWPEPYACSLNDGICSYPSYVLNGSDFATQCKIPDNKAKSIKVAANVCQASTPVTSTKELESSTFIGMIVVIAVLLVSNVICFAIAACGIIERRKKGDETNAESVNLSPVISPSPPSVGDASSDQVSVYNPPGGELSAIMALAQLSGDEETTELRRLFCSPEKIFLGQIIGRGRFSFVHQAIITSTYENESQEVALKFPRSPETYRAAVTEVMLTRNLDHPNIIKCIGISYKLRRLCLIFPLMPNGNLRDYLQLCFSVLNDSDLIRFAIQICRGLIYLKEKNILHRDLACRNIFVARDISLKIGDFGLSQLAENMYDLRSVAQRPKPFRWYPPEYFTNGIFDHKSEVWSYGVILWEIFSGGQRPYGDLSTHSEVQSFLEAGRRMAKPERCPNRIFDHVLNKCWQTNPQDRPSLENLLSWLALEPA